MLITIYQALCWVETVLLMVALFSGLHYNLQMFQQNGYKNGEYFNWGVRNSERQRFLMPTAFIFLVQYWVKVPALQLILAVVMIIWSIAMIMAYTLYWKTETKKKLVVTARVRRLIATIVIIYVVFFVIFHRVAWFWTGLYLFAVQEIIILCNVINHPLEAGINRHYIHDAQRIIRANPQIKIIGITGSYGKTSMKYYLNTLLKDFYDVLITPGNFNTTLGVVRTIREHLKPSNQIFLCEMGARHVHDIKEICDLFPPQ
ncbi:MAG: Mur ligase family protein, partial [Candidatus Weimeria sp.]